MKNFFIKCIVILFIIHLGYYIYGYYDFKKLSDADAYFDFYKFKFYDDVSISHFFITSIFLGFFTLFLIKNYRSEIVSLKKWFLITTLIFFTISLSCCFFISFSLGQRTKIHVLLPEESFDKDKKLLNILNSFLYNHISGSTFKSFDFLNVLYPDPYPVVLQIDSIYSDSLRQNFLHDEYHYYSIDTLKMKQTTFDGIKKGVDTFFNVLDIKLDKLDLTEKIIAKRKYKDSIEIIYKGSEVNTQYNDPCIFMMNSYLFKSNKREAIYKQKYDCSKKRYDLLFTYKKDSLVYKFRQLDSLFKKYEIESNINSDQLTNKIMNIKNKNSDIYSIVNGMDNYFDRDKLSTNFTTLDNLIYKPNYLNSSIRDIFFYTISIISVIILFLYWLFNKHI